MPAPSVKGYMPLCVTPRSLVCDEQGVGQWPMWKRFDSIKAIVDRYIETPYRNFLAMPVHDVDKLKAEELFYWYTPRDNTAYCRLSRMADDSEHYKAILSKTLKHYNDVIVSLKNSGKNEEASFLELSLKYAGQWDNNVYCGNDHVVATVWGMRPRENNNISGSTLVTELIPELEMYTVQFDLGMHGTSESPTSLKKRAGSKVTPKQVPQVKAKNGFVFSGWDKEPGGAEVNSDLVFMAQYREQPKTVAQSNTNADDKKDTGHSTAVGSSKDSETTTSDNVSTANNTHHVRFLGPDGATIKELDVDHGCQVQPGQVPQLPVVNGVVCPSWDKNPLSEVVNADCDFKAVAPRAAAKESHTVRFLAPDGAFLSQTSVVHGETLKAMQVPPLPVFEGKICPSWNVDPLAVVINADTDFRAQKMHDVVEVEKEQHKVRFIDKAGNELMSTLVPHGDHLKPDQIPPVPSVNGQSGGRWTPNPAKQVINSDTDFIINEKKSRLWSFSGSGGKGFWRWLLRILLAVLLIFLILYVFYLFNPCSK